MYTLFIIDARKVIICLPLILTITVIILLVLLCYFSPYFYILGSGKEEVLGRGAGLLPEPKYALDGEFSLVFKNVYLSLILIKTVIILLVLLLCYFTPYFYILGSGKEEVLGRGAGLLPEPKYIYIYIWGVWCIKGP